MTKPKWILLAEDNAHDAALARRALASSEPRPEIVIVRDGVEALHCLHHQGRFHRAKGNPAVVLLDLKMPRMDGFEVLEELKADVHLRHIPVVIFTSSCEERDVVRCYRLGANAYVVKPMDFRKYVAALQGVTLFWTATNEPPPEATTHEESAPARSLQHHFV